MKVNPNPTLISWARAKLESTDASVSDESLASTVISKLQQFPGISYAEIAKAAYQSGRHLLATMVCRFLKNPDAF
jgi:hypothetical protein